MKRKNIRRHVASRSLSALALLISVFLISTTYSMANDTTIRAALYPSPTGGEFYASGRCSSHD